MTTEKKSTPTAPSLADDERTLFREAVAGSKPIVSDTIAPSAPAARLAKQPRLKSSSASLPTHKQQAEFFFSDDFHAHFGEGPLKYVAPGDDPYLAKQLRRGDFQPEVILDVHGHTQASAKRELAALLVSCQREQVSCCVIMHGYGEGVLRRSIPHWLVQHPHVRAFHQAPREWGGDAAIILLLALT